MFWFEHDLYDQLQLLDALALVADSGVAVGSLELILVDSFPGRPAFRGLGELEADELETLWASRVRATPSLVATAAEVWDAVRAPTPIALAEASGRPLDDLPFVPAALRRLLAELPGARDGLSGTERRALRAIAEGAATPFAVFAAAQDAEEAPFLGDAWFFRALSHLGSGDSRLSSSLSPVMRCPRRLRSGTRTSTAGCACGPPRSAGACSTATRTQSSCWGSTAGSAARTSFPARSGAGTAPRSSCRSPEKFHFRCERVSHA